MVELGCIDISTEVSMLSSHNAYSHEGHFQATLHIMYYFKGKHNSRLTLDPTYPSIFYENFDTKKDWAAFYGDVVEAILLNAPMPLGKSVDLRIMVDSDHPGVNTTSQSCTGFTIFVNLALITQLLKKQPTVESAV